MKKRSGDNCIVLCRVSDPADPNKGDSYEDQEATGRRIAQHERWTVLRVFREPLSGRKDVRPVIEEIVSFVTSSPTPVHHLIVRSIDRLTRAGAVEYAKLKERMEALGINVVDSYGLIQPKQNTLEHLGVEYDWSVYSPSETTELVTAHSAHQEVRNNLTRMIGAEIKLVREGYKVRQPADGYQNKRIVVDGKERVIEVPDPDRAKYFEEMFRLRSQGTLSDKEIVERINAMGFRTKGFKRWNKTKDRIIGRSLPRPLTVKHFQEIIKRPIYCGVRVEKWTGGEPVRTQYPGLISIATFNQANHGTLFIERHGDGNLSLHRGGSRCPRRRKSSSLYPYKNVVMCPKCESKPCYASASKGKKRHYPAYHCHRGHYFRVPAAEFDRTVDGYLETLTLKPEYRERFTSQLRAAWDDRQTEVSTLRRRVEKNGRRLREQQDAVVESLIGASPLVREKLESRVEELEAEIQKAQVSEEDVSSSDFDGFVDWALQVLEHPVEMLKNPRNLALQQASFEILFEDPPTYDQMAFGTPNLRLPFKLDWLFDEPESECVHTPRLAWNSIAPSIACWKEYARKGTFHYFGHRGDRRHAA